MTYGNGELPNGGWIPVSERLPEDLEDVLVSDGVDMFVAWCRKGIRAVGVEWSATDASFDEDTPIVAWQPLPEPYEPQERSKE